MTSVRAQYIPSSDGISRLHTLIWAPEQPRAVLQIAHGMAEHIARYDDFAKWMCQQGIAVVGANHLGHGLTATSGELGYFAAKDGWEHVVEDIGIVRDYAASVFPGTAQCILGHSMGSFLTRHYLTTPHSAGLSCAVISGTANHSVLLASVAGGLSGALGLIQGKKHRSSLVNQLSFGSYNNAFKPNRTEFDWLCRDCDVVDKYCADPLCGFVFTLSAYRDLFRGLKYIARRKNTAKISKNLPCMFIAGDRDPVGSCGNGVRQVAESFTDAGVKEVVLKLYPDCRHEVLNEQNRLEVYSDVLGFMEKYI